MATASRLSELSPARLRLVELMRSVHFGRLERLQVRGGEPLFQPPPVVVREVKFGGENGPRRGPAKRDFQLKAQVVELFGELDRLGDGTVVALEVKHGLPFRLLVAEAV